MKRLYLMRGIAAALLAGVITAACSDVSLNAPDDPAVEITPHVFQAQVIATDQWLDAPDVMGTALGRDANGTPVLKMYVREAGVTGLPYAVEGVPVEVEVTGEFYALQVLQTQRAAREGQVEVVEPRAKGGKGPKNPPVDRTARFDRPVPIGISTGHPDITAGTIGMRVKKAQQVFALSNNHVYAASNAASIGDDVLQPGAFDGGVDPADAIGTLHAYVPIDFSGGDNMVDAAIALTSAADLGNSTPSDGYGTPKSITLSPTLNLSVQKYGRTTGQTQSTISGINATVNVNYGAAGIARFVGQIVIGGGNFSAGGDSGSLIVARGKGKNKADDLKPVGLLFAGSATATIANPIDDVLDAFGVTIDGG